MAVVGRASVLIVPSLKGFNTALAKETAKAGSQAGTRTSGALGSALKKGAVGVGVAAGGVLSTALFKGFDRLKNIENAQAKLRGLGHSAEAVKGIMDNALAAVKGTAFGLDEAATVAAGAVAAGVKPGKDLEGTLKLIADAATIGGTSMGEMGAIFNKVASSGKVQGDIINQLNDKGIPIMQLLGEAMGKTTEEVQEMSRKGTIDFATFQKAMEKGLGGAALKSGDTTIGAFKNMGAALGRVGANLLSGVFPKFRETFAGIIEALGPMEDKAKVVGEKIGEYLGLAADTVKLFIGSFTGKGADVEVPWMNKVIDAGAAARAMVDALIPKFKAVGSYVKDTLIPTIGNLVGWLIKNKDVVIPLVAAVASGVLAFKAVVAVIRIATAVQMLWNAAMLLNPIGLVIGLIVGLVAGIVVLYKKNEAFRTLVQKVWSAIKTGVSAVVNWFVKTALPALKGFFDKIGAAAKWLWDKIIKPVAGFIVGAFQNIGKVLKAVWDKFLSPVFQLIGAIVVWLWKKVFSVYFGFIKTAAEGLGKAIKYLWTNWVKPNIDKIAGIIKTLWTNYVKPFIDKIKGKLSEFGAKIRQVWKDHVHPVVNRIGEVIGGLKEKFKTGVDAIKTQWDRIKEIAKKPIDFVVKTVINQGLIGGFNWLADKLGTDKMATIPWPPKGWARGGILPGFTPVSRGDDVLMGMRSGEGVYVSEAMRDPYERARLRAVNRAALAGHSLRGFQGLARGGIVDTLGAGDSASDARKVVQYHGHSFTRLFRDALQRAEQMLGFALHIFQGGFRPATSYSGTSHAGDAIDVGPVTGAVVRALRAVGVAAWDRTGKGNWAPHIHGVPIPGYGFAGGSGVWQAQDYLKGGDGLGGRDNGPNVKPGGGGAFLDDLKEKFSKVMGSMKERFANNPLGQLIGGIPTKVKDALFGKAKDAAKLSLSLINPLGYAVGKWIGGKIKGVFQGEALNNAQTIAEVGKKLGFDNRGIKIALMTAMQESSLKNLKYGDRDSVGLFQQRAPWGSFADRTNPAISASMFFKGGQGGQRGLSSFPWRTMGLGEAAQAVQVSAFPGAYSKWAGEAQNILEKLHYDSGGLLQPGYTLAYNGTGRPEPVFTDRQWKTLSNQGGSSPLIGELTMVSQGNVRKDFEEIEFRLRTLDRGGVYGRRS